MPRREDIQRILILGSGPIVIGQAAEFDYSGVQACKVLREEGYEVVLMNSNPATIMTDPELADATYVEPLLPGPAAQVIERERPDALLPTLGGQTALNLSKALHDDGTLERFGVELIGADHDAIACAEDRRLFGAAMAEAGLRMPASAIASGWDEELCRVDVKRGLAQALDALPEIGLPCVVRPAYTLGGRGGGIARTPEEFSRVVAHGLEVSPIGQVLLDQSVLGWGEFELEVMRDRADNVVIVCSIENIDPMGVHTGDSVTVAPQQTLSDRLYQRLRDQAIAVIRAVGVETGGSNVQFAVDPATEEVLVIEMNPRVSRSSALASKATGFPIAKIAARLAVGYLLEEIPNDITKLTPACFEPTIDYVVVKWPRFAFEKFPGAESTLSTHMKSVGEAMAIGRTFAQAFAKALRSRELDKPPCFEGVPDGELLAGLEVPAPERFEAILELFRRGAEIEGVHELTAIDPWFLRELRALALDPEAPFAGQRTFKSVDTCAAEFPAQTPYYYSGWERPAAPLLPPAGGAGEAADGAARPEGVLAGAPAHEVRRGERPSVVILGAGPNRIGQGIEFDYCCVHAAITVRESGRDAVMINCNPETVSTDYDTSDRLYFEPLTLEDVLGVVEVERPEGVIVQFGGQTPLKLAAGLHAAGVPLLGTSVEAIDLAEHRGRFGELLDRLGYRAPPYATACTVGEALDRAEQVGYPLLVRPSYVLGGRAMEIVYSREGLADYLRRELGGGHAGSSASPAGDALVGDALVGDSHSGRASSHDAPAGDASVGASAGGHPPPNPDNPSPARATIYLDRFLENAIELDVDALCDGEEVWIGGIMQHVEEAGVHSGDSACVLPPHSLGEQMLAQIRAATRELALAIGVVGLINVQYAVLDAQLYVIEANPRASRTVPFVSKAVGLPLAKLACRVMLGEPLAALGLPREREGLGFGTHVSVKEAVLPFDRFEGADAVLGPEMRSTGEVMGIARDFPTAFAKAQAAAGCPLPLHGTVFISVTDADKAGVFAIAQLLHDNGFRILATGGTAAAIARMGIPAQALNKVSEGGSHVLDWIERGDVDLVVNTPSGSGARTDGWRIRRAAVTRDIPCLTTLAAGVSAARAIASARHNGPAPVLCLQELHRGREAPASGEQTAAGRSDSPEQSERPEAGVA
ncbi:MAG TPA: carbamoyl-phosphate synthase large subunit [Solirubrobacteraceae bacterium]|jgi:carbamoyl-phosphate synthase large subunit|nr:carbamoyl-phosphate synthase large subunit [Solirubrobacteraceae bacterium]